MTTYKKITMRITGNTTMVGVDVNDLRRAYGATESTRICVSCDAPFFPHREKTDLCIRCEQRRDDMLSRAKVTAWVIGALIITVIAAASRMHGASVVDDALLNRVSWAESRNNPKAIGKLGEVGAFQLRPIAIREVNRVYGTKYHIRDARKMVTSREIARLYLLICESRLKNPTPDAVYRRYRGFTFRQ